MVFYFSDKPPFARHEVLAAQDLSAGEEWKYSATMNLQDIAKVVVVAEELATGMWGGSVAPMARKKEAEKDVASTERRVVAVPAPPAGGGRR